MRNKIIFFTFVILAISGVAFSAPTLRYDRTILPETDSTYELGTSSKAWLRVTSDELCLGSSCNTTWPTGGVGPSTDPFMASHYVATSTTATSTLPNIDGVRNITGDFPNSYKYLVINNPGYWDEDYLIPGTIELGGPDSVMEVRASRTTFYTPVDFFSKLDFSNDVDYFGYTRFLDAANFFGPTNFLNDFNVGIGTTSPYAKLSVAGEVVAEKFTATSTTATSTVTNLAISNRLLFAPIILSKTDGTQIPYGQGATSDTERGTALQSAVAHALSAGDTIFLYGGNYAISDSISLASSTSLVGIGRPVISSTFTSAPTIELKNSTTTITGINVVTNSTGIGYIGASTLHFTDMLIDDVKVTSASTDDCAVAWGVTCNSAAGGNHYIEGVIKDSVLKGGSLSNFGIRVLLATGSRLQLIDNEVFGATDGILINGDSDATVEVYGGYYTSTLDPITSGGATIYVNGAKARGLSGGTNADIWEDGGNIIAVGADYNTASDYVEGNFNVPVNLNVGSKITTVNASTTNTTISGKLFDSLGSAGTNGMVLQTTGLASKWVATSSLGFLGGTTVSSVGTGYVPKWDGTKFVNSGIVEDASSLSLDAGENPILIGDYSFDNTGGGMSFGNYFDTFGNPMLVGAGSLYLTAAPANSSAYNMLDVDGGAAIGTYAGVNTAPSNGLIVSGNLGIGTTSPYAKLSVAGNTYIGGNLTATGTLTLQGGTTTATNGINLSSGCFAVNGTCVGGGGASLSGGSTGALTYWTSATGVGATTSPTVGYITATSTTATSTFLGKAQVGRSYTGLSPRLLVNDATDSVVVEAPTGGSATQTESGNYMACGMYYEFAVYAYKTVGGITVYSSPLPIDFYDNDINEDCDSTYFDIDLSWTASSGADGYKVVIVTDEYNGSYNDNYMLTATNSITVDGNYNYQNPIVTTPQSPYNPLASPYGLGVIGNSIFKGYSQFEGNIYATGTQMISAPTGSSGLIIKGVGSGGSPSYHPLKIQNSTGQDNFYFGNSEFNGYGDYAAAGFVGRSAESPYMGDFVWTDANNALPNTDARVGFLSLQGSGSGSSANYAFYLGIRNTANNTTIVPLAVSSSGGVGIGDNTPDGKLEVRQTTTDDIFNLYDNTTNVFTVIDGGNVGIGTISPSRKLHVVGGGAITGNLGLGDSNPALYWKNGNDLRLGVSADGISTGSFAEHMRITSSGNVGIGTTSPAVKLDVHGGGIRIDPGTSSMPTCDASLRGTMWYVKGGSDEWDMIHVCMKEDIDLYSWMTIAP